MDDLAYSKSHWIESNANFNLFADEQYIYLLQKPKAPYLTETEELNTFETVNKQILCFNYGGKLVKVLNVDASIELRNAVILNQKLYSSKTIKGKAKIYEYKLD